MAFLKIMSGEQTGQEFQIDRDELSIGRSDQNVISLDDASISGKHCLIIRNGKKFSIRDLHSTNGTRVNGRNISESRLKSGDAIMAGSIEILIEGSEIEAEPETQVEHSRATTTPTVIMTPQRATSSTPPPAFHKKRDNRMLIGIVVGACLILVAVALVWFIMNVMK